MVGELLNHVELVEHVGGLELGVWNLEPCRACRGGGLVHGVSGVPLRGWRCSLTEGLTSLHRGFDFPLRSKRPFRMSGH